MYFFRWGCASKNNFLSQYKIETNFPLLWVLIGAADRRLLENKERFSFEGTEALPAEINIEPSPQFI
ncbi:hypothetical protein CWR45_12195 [Oceanobacillus chungangensis]|uniref:Uncharacterized protein n=1 Tax=Oceanobacillus chungangensis TaxID=1229152 RepID=A0A3D8PN28_9BACI|nr:hypothetical protein CWR45_12195 [Oceanobacillus chungangensis]